MKDQAGVANTAVIFFAMSILAPCPLPRIGGGSQTFGCQRESQEWRGHGKLRRCVKARGIPDCNDSNFLCSPHKVTLWVIGGIYLLIVTK